LGSSSTLLTGIMAYWKLDSSSVESVIGTVMSDVSMSYATGKINNAATFDGSTARYTYATDSTFAQLGTSNFSINLWINPASLSNANQCVLGKEDTAGNNGYIRYGISSSGIAFDVRGLGANFEDTNTFSSSKIVTGSWNMVTIVRNNTDAKIYCYVNGQRIDAGIVLTTAHSYDVGSNGWTIGTAVNRAGTDGSAFRFNGLIDEIGIWNKALTQEEINSLYSGTAGLQYPFGISFTKVMGFIFG
jgi:hypothetical protein